MVAVVGRVEAVSTVVEQLRSNGVHASVMVKTAELDSEPVRALKAASQVVGKQGVHTLEGLGLNKFPDRQRDIQVGVCS